MYVTPEEVYATAGITSTEIPEANVNGFILDAESEVDRFTNTTYWSVREAATADSSTANTLTDANAFAGDNFENEYVWVYGGTGVGQVREVESHDDDTLTLDRNWTVNPDNTSTYRIIHTGSPAYISTSDGLYDGDNTDTFFLPKYPLVLLESVTIDSTSVTPSTIYQYKPQGKIVLSQDSEFTRFTSLKAQKNVMAYWWGLYPIPRLVKRYVLLLSALMCQAAQAGGTFNVPSTYSLPEGSLTIGQSSHQL